MTTLKTVTPKRWHHQDARIEVRAEDQLPPGIAGRVMGVALTYGVVDSYGTMFQPGSAKRSIDTKVAARKVPLLMDHDRTVASHVGVVTAMQDVGDTLIMTADVFDTPDGRSALEYVKAVLASGASTGFSIGFVPRKSDMVAVEGQPVELFREIELREVSITPMPAVPGADITAARAEQGPNDSVITDHDPGDEQPEPEAVRSDTDLLILAAKAALNALPDAVRHEVVRAYVATGDRTDHGAVSSHNTTTTSAVSEPATVSVAGLTLPDSRSAVAAPVPMTARAQAVRASYAVPTQNR
jgi:HK97 family phage prohead protease